jgi:hypothetical protein
MTTFRTRPIEVQAWEFSPGTTAPQWLAPYFRETKAAVGEMEVRSGRRIEVKPHSVIVKYASGSLESMARWRFHLIFEAVQ